MEETLLLDLEAARRELGGLSVSSIRRVVNRGELGLVRLGRRVFVRRDSLEALVRRRAAGPLRYKPPASRGGRSSRGR